MFWTGALPALLVFWVRRTSRTPREAARPRASRAPSKGSFTAIFRRGTTAALGCCGPRSSRRCWPPASRAATTRWPPGCPPILKTERGLSVVGTGGYLAFLISGAFIGYLTGGYLTDRLGRKRNIWLVRRAVGAC